MNHRTWARLVVNSNAVLMLSPQHNRPRWWGLLKITWLFTINLALAEAGEQRPLHFTPFVRQATLSAVGYGSCSLQRSETAQRELANGLTHFSVGVIAFPFSLLFHFKKMPELAQLNPGRRCSAAHSLSICFSLSSPFLPPWLESVSNAGQKAPRQSPSELRDSCKSFSALTMVSKAVVTW